MTVVFLLSTGAQFSLPDSPTWLALVPAFVLSELTIIHFELRKQTVSWATSEIPMVMGLFLFGPTPTVTARAVAVAVVVIKNGYPPGKVIFNVAVAVVEAALAGWLLRDVDLTDVVSPLMWLGVIAALLVTGAVGVCCIALAILITEGSVSRSFWFAMVVPLLAIVPMAAALGIVVLLLIEVTPWAAVLAVGLLGLFVLLYRRYAAAAQDRRSLAEVYDFAEMVQNAGNDRDSETVILQAIREKFNAARAALWLPSHLDQGPRSLAVVSTGDGAAGYPGPDDPDDAIRLQTTAGQGARLINEARANQQDLRGLRRRGVTELLCVPLETETAELGYLE
ncbi:MAG: GGDEF-domain containing protein, partial [Actinomycetota bacterium]|nr:GGDEF-domain containing protein [Actinomycetota bacterium]